MKSPLWPIAILVLLAGCKQEPAPPRPAPAAPVRAPPAAPVWPGGLTQELVRIDVTRTRQGEAPRSVTVVRGTDGTWLCLSPRRGEADPDAFTRLSLALEAPQLLPAAAATGPVEFDIRLLSRTGRATHLLTRQAPLGGPVPVTIEGVGDFTASPVELSTKLPDPRDFLPAGLWVTAIGRATSVEVKGPARYRLVSGPAGWKSADGRSSRRELDGVPGVIIGRQTVGHPEGSQKALGLDPPLAVATLCAGERCRDFKLGRVDEAGRTRYYAVAPDADPIELRDADWKLLAEGPWQKDR
ncbi:MAG: hypothetical protein ACYC8T_36125 [Myxococcaceae bacterium]